MPFEQAALPIQQQAEFQELKQAIDRVFSAPQGFLKGLKSNDVLVRNFEAALALGLIERNDAVLKQQGRSARQIYQALPVSDQAQIREFYLERLERVPEEWRRKFHTVYRLA